MAQVIYYLETKIKSGALNEVFGVEWGIWNIYVNNCVDIFHEYIYVPMGRYIYFTLYRGSSLEKTFVLYNSSQ